MIALIKVFIVAPLVETGNGEDIEEYSVGLVKISFVVKKVLDEVVVEKVCE